MSKVEGLSYMKFLDSSAYDTPVLCCVAIVVLCIHHYMDVTAGSDQRNHCHGTDVKKLQIRTHPIIRTDATSSPWSHAHHLLPLLPSQASSGHFFWFAKNLIFCIAASPVDQAEFQRVTQVMGNGGRWNFNGGPSFPVEIRYPPLPPPMSS